MLALTRCAGEEIVFEESRMRRIETWRQPSCQNRTSRPGTGAGRTTVLLEPHPSTRPEAPSMRRVLVADPCADTVESTTWLLRLWGHDVRGAESGPEVLEVARSYQPDAVLMEIGLPGMDGYEVARRLRRQEELPHLLLVAITGYGNERYRRRAWDAGFDHFLVKPADPEVVRELLATSKVRELQAVKRRYQTQLC